MTTTTDALTEEKEVTSLPAATIAANDREGTTKMLTPMKTNNNTHRLGQ
jgi:hypothetical protein